jgi:quinoprotein glucose dehydrogenase
MGMFNFGGAQGTRSGLVFAGASQDHAFRAFDARTGKLLFQADLPASSASTPMSYRGRSGRQFVVISSEAPGGARTGPYNGALTAFVLPER